MQKLQKKSVNEELQSVTKITRFAPFVTMLSANLLGHFWPELSSTAFPDLAKY